MGWREGRDDLRRTRAVAARLATRSGLDGDGCRVACEPEASARGRSRGDPHEVMLRSGTPRREREDAGRLDLVVGVKAVGHAVDDDAPGRDIRESVDLE